MRRRTTPGFTFLAPYLFLSPFLILFGAFLTYPLVRAAVLSLYSTRGFHHSRFIGFGNYSRLLADPVFWTSLANTAEFTIGSLIVQIPAAFALALALNAAATRFKNAYRFAFFSPALFSGVVVSIVSFIFFEGRYGLLNRLIALAGISSELGWFQDKQLVMPAIILIAAWKWAGLNMVYFLAGLQSVPRDLIDAARVDGASWAATVWHVTLPHLKPIAGFVVILSVINSLQLFDLPLLLTNGGPDNASMTAVLYLYKNGFQFLNLGYASAMGWVLFAVIFAASIAQVRLFRTFSETG